MRIRQAKDIDHTSWDAFVLDHPEGLPYQLYAWKKAVEKAYGFRGVYLLAEEHERICGVLPLVWMNIPLLGRKLISLPYCDVGGALAYESAVAAALFAEARKLASLIKFRAVEIRSAVPTSLGCVRNSFPIKKVRMVLELPGDSRTLLAGLKSKLRSQVNKPLRDGLKISLGGLELVSDFYRTFTENMRDLGSPVHSREWIEAVVGFFGERARVGVVYTPGGMPAAGGIILLHRKTVSIPWASSLRRLNHLNPNMLLYWTFLAFAADNGYSRFDFGRSTPGEGTYKFKEQWGARPQPLVWSDLLEVDRKKNTTLAVKRARMEALWRRLPLEICNSLGPKVRRWISL
jgi:FemAB-related protein (PEP-CTERM system-associated)